MKIYESKDKGRCILYDKWESYSASLHGMIDIYQFLAPDGSFFNIMVHPKIPCRKENSISTQHGPPEFVEPTIIERIKYKNKILS